jgi:hypothetical protein
MGSMCHVLRSCWSWCYQGMRDLLLYAVQHPYAGTPMATRPNRPTAPDRPAGPTRFSVRAAAWPPSALTMGFTVVCTRRAVCGVGSSRSGTRAWIRGRPSV